MMFAKVLRLHLRNKQQWSWQSVKETLRKRSHDFIEAFSRRKVKTEARQSRSVREQAATRAQFSRKFYHPGFLQRLSSKWSAGLLVSQVSARIRGGLFSRDSMVLTFAGFALATKSSLLTEEEETESLSFEIRDAFSKLSQNDEFTFPEHFTHQNQISMKDLDIDQLVGQGCSAAVYSARWKQENGEPRSSSDVDGILHAVDDMFPYDLAVKVLFNYSAESNSSAVWHAMYKEALPAVIQLPFVTNRKCQTRRIPPHPNIVRMHCAFSDEMPYLAGALNCYPQALPQRLSSQGYGRNMTMFIVMKRYHCSLKEYLKEKRPDFETSLLLLTQILEGVVHLQQNGFVHRDLKSDNILLDLTSDYPALAITDFGCCLEGSMLCYTSEEVDRGGNLALMAPEILSAVPGPFVTLDYSKSDLWTVGTLAYEIFGAENPFYQFGQCVIEPVAYSEEDLPPLTQSVPVPLQMLIKDILHRDPQKRPPATFAATVCQLLIHAPPELLSLQYSKMNRRKVIDWFLLLSAETFLQTALETQRVSDVKLKLRDILCRRVQFGEVFQALQYISDAFVCGDVGLQ